MKQIGANRIFVGNKDEIGLAREKGMFIVNAVRNCKGYECHKSVVGWKGNACDKNSPYYFYFSDLDALYLNLIDSNKVEYIPDQIIDIFLETVKEKLDNGRDVFICCSLGLSRSPSLALIYLLENNLFDNNNSIESFREEFYQQYEPKQGFVDYIERKYGQ